MIPYLKLTSTDGTPTYIRVDRIDAVFTTQRRLTESRERTTLAAVVVSNQQSPALVTESVDTVMQLVDQAWKPPPVSTASTVRTFPQ